MLIVLVLSWMGKSTSIFAFHLLNHLHMLHVKLVPSLVLHVLLLTTFSMPNSMFIIWQLKYYVHIPISWIIYASHVLLLIAFRMCGWCSSFEYYHWANQVVRLHSISYITCVLCAQLDNRFLLSLILHVLLPTWHSWFKYYHWAHKVVCLHSISQINLCVVLRKSGGLNPAIYMNIIKEFCAWQYIYIICKDIIIFGFC